MLTIVAWIALILSALNWLLFVGLTVMSDLPQLRRLLNAMLSTATARQEAPLERTELQAAIDPTKIAAATGSLAGAFKKAGAAPTAAAMSLMFFLFALVAAGVNKY